MRNTLRHSVRIASSFVWPVLRHSAPQVQQSPYTSQSASQRHVRRAAANSQESVQLPQQSRFGVVSRKLPRVLELVALATSTVIYSLGGITCSMKLQRSSNTTVLINRPSRLDQLYSSPFSTACNCVWIYNEARPTRACHSLHAHSRIMHSSGVGHKSGWNLLRLAELYCVWRYR